MNHLSEDRPDEQRIGAGRQGPENVEGSLTVSSFFGKDLDMSPDAPGEFTTYCQAENSCGWISWSTSALERQMKEKAHLHVRHPYDSVRRR